VVKPIALLFSLLAAHPALAAPDSELAARQFSHPDLSIKTHSVALDQARSQVPNGAAWDAFQGRHGGEVAVFVDARSGRPSSVVGGIPLLPGSGKGNQVSLDDVRRRLGRAVTVVDEAVVRDVVRAFVRENEGAFAIDVAQLGAGRAVQVRDGFWQVSLPQEHRGVPVRYGRVVATLKAGNLVVFGTETWGPVALDAVPRVSPNDALAAGFEAIGGRSPADELVDARLEIVPTEAADPSAGQVQAGGYGHRLVWSFRFQRADDVAVWETLVDAHNRQVISFQEVSDSIRRPMTGRVYSPTSTEVCPTPGTCGVTQSVPMPFADTGLAPPFQTTSSAGLYVNDGLPVTTTLSGPFVKIYDQCGPISETAQGAALNLGGSTGQHDCATPPGASAGNTSAARSTFYELNKLTEMARGWLPGLPYLQQPIPARVNVGAHCNASYNPVQNFLNFFEGGGGCRNTGEIATVADHEWGHALDYHDAAGKSNTSEGFADIVAIYRQGVSCVGHGMLQTLDVGCGQSADGAGFNAEESDGGPGAPHCALDCSGVRDADWDRHAHHSPDTPQNFVCGSCKTGNGPCGRAVHCAGAPIRQAAWDLFARDLQAPPFDLDGGSASILANKLFYEGSGNVGNWYECDCGHGTSGGCGAGSGYMQWLAADDDNGTLLDGTPHLTAIGGAFGRHGIACSVPHAGNGGCAHRPAEAPTVTLTTGSNRVSLAWTAVAGAQEYWVFRGEGRDACRLGKTRIGRVSALDFTDIQVADDRPYCYSVTAVGATDECVGPAGTVQVTPQPPSPAFELTCTEQVTMTPGSIAIVECGVQSVDAFSKPVELGCSSSPTSGVSCSLHPPTVTPPADGSLLTRLRLALAPGVAPPGPQAVTVVGRYQNLVRQAIVDVVIPPPNE
jgi:hypothetical protein